MESINTYYEDYVHLSEFVESNHGLLFDSERSDILVQIFSGLYKQDVIARLSAEIATLVPHAKIIGTTTSGEIMNGQVTGLKIVLSFTVFRNTTVKTGIFYKEDQDEFNLGREVASTLGSDKSKLLILFATGVSFDSDQMLKGIPGGNLLKVFLSIPVNVEGVFCRI
ncbi:hypothetical protein Dred_3258 [Desulforamulus reducens MI-1]|uniref:FIST domain-containing protein n=1 Tax=Desulforamulus reducens (strain ATCC BAA-1160 / DSM 100696 / MI-1) TaxID=349161 RepID=A4J9K5_DESRM|nr:FIST N-terminal domain-containing protein [Desulforamulus reducens]ABO51758.1 hypothetical protein Dred_3258 [Desulforamulus reducens MI-1]